MSNSSLTGQDKFSLFRTLFVDVLRGAAPYERDFLRILHQYTMRLVKVKDENSRLEMVRDFSIFNARYAKLRHKLFVLHSRLQKAVVARSMNSPGVANLEQDVFVSYSGWHETKSDFTKSLTTARAKWDKYIHTETPL